MRSHISAKNPGEETFLLARMDLLLHCLSTFLIVVLLAELICLLIIFLCVFEVAQLLVRISQPGIGNSLLFIQMHRLVKTLPGIVELPHSEESCPLVVVVDRMFGLYLNSPVVRFNCLLVLFQLVESCPQVAVVGCHLAVKLYGLGGQPHLFLKIS